MSSVIVAEQRPSAVLVAVVAEGPRVLGQPPRRRVARDGQVVQVVVHRRAEGRAAFRCSQRGDSIARVRPSLQPHVDAAEAVAEIAAIAANTAAPLASQAGAAP